LEELSAEQIFHAPRKGLNDKLYPIRPGSSRRDGYLTRAWSPGIVDAEFDAAVDRHYTPFFQGVFKQDQTIDCIALRKLLDKIFLSRCFWRPLLDEVGRPGLVSQIAAIPVEAFSRGISFTTIYETMRDYEAKNGVQSGEISPLSITWDNQDQNDPDNIGSAVLPREYVSKIFSYVSSPDLHVLAILKNTSSEDRRKAAFFLAKLFQKLDSKSYSLTSTIPVDLVINDFTVVVAERDNDFGNNDNWRKVRVGVASNSSTQDANELKAKSEALLDEVYGKN
jgi:hypothetical protein